MSNTQAHVGHHTEEEEEKTDTDWVEVKILKYVDDSAKWDQEEQHREESIHDFLESAAIMRKILFAFLEDKPHLL